MQHIRQEISQMEVNLELQSFYDWLEKEEKLGTSFKAVVKSLLESTDEDIFNQMDQIMLDITEKVNVRSIFPYCLYLINLYFFRCHQIFKS